MGRNRDKRKRRVPEGSDRWEIKRDRDSEERQRSKDGRKETAW
jgi:hypothetical protein